MQFPSRLREGLAEGMPILSTDLLAVSPTPGPSRKREGRA
jgi:hypothetical protein